MKKNKKFLINKIENEKGAITALVLASLLVITVVFINLYMIGSNKSSSQDKEIKMIQEAYNYTDDEIDSKYKSSVVFENVNVADTNPKGALPANIKEIVENDANKGIVIKDNNDNEWVWVEVPKTTVFSGLGIDTTSTLTAQNYTDIANKMITYVGVYRKGAWNQNYIGIDEWYDGCGLTQQEYISAYQSMLKFVYNFGGFWIGRYEAGIDGSITDLSKARTSHTDIEIGKSPKAISQKDAIPYNWVYCSEAQKLSDKMAPDNNFRSSLMFGIQWDLVCKFLEVKSDLNVEDINKDSSRWGDYRNSNIAVTSENAKQTVDLWNTWKKIIGVKSENVIIGLSTGASENAKKMNIYDFAGNEWEWILECASYSLNNHTVHRGGGAHDKGYEYPVTHKAYYNSIYSNYIVSFRATLYKN